MGGNQSLTLEPKIYLERALQGVRWSRVRFPTKNDDFPTTNDDFPTKNDDFPTKSDDFLLLTVMQMMIL